MSSSGAVPRRPDRARPATSAVRHGGGRLWVCGFQEPAHIVLTKGQLRKLNALRESVGNDIRESAFSEWLESQTTTVPADKNAERIADALWPLIEQWVLKIPRGGYIVKRGRGRIVFEPAES